MNAPSENNESKKRAVITPEQEELLRAFEQAKKLGYGEFSVFIQGGNIVRYEIKKSKMCFKQKGGTENISEAAEDMKKLSCRETSQ
jgi:hypothetical protein